MRCVFYTQLQYSNNAMYATTLVPCHPLSLDIGQLAHTGSTGYMDCHGWSFISIHKDFFQFQFNLSFTDVFVTLTVLGAKRVENGFLHTLGIISVILHAIHTQDIST